MGTFSSMNDRSTPRAFPWIWYIRLAQIVITLIVLVLAAMHADSWKSCTVPAKIAYNLACAILGFIIIMYFIFSTGPTTVSKSLPWLIWGQLALDGFMFILWIAAAGTSTLDCDDYCNACSGWGEVVWDNLRCDCYVSVFDDYFFKRNISPAPRGLAGPLEPRYTRGYRRSGARIGSLSARTAFDALMVLLFAITLISTIWWIIKEKRSSGTSTTQPPAHEEAGAPAGIPTSATSSPAPAYIPSPHMQQGQQHYPQEMSQPPPAGYEQTVPQVYYTSSQSAPHPGPNELQQPAIHPPGGTAPATH